MRVFLIEDGHFSGTFYPMSRLRFDAAGNEWQVRDPTIAHPESLRELGIAMGDIRSVLVPAFPEFDEVRSWRPVDTDQPVMHGHVAFGPNDATALVVQVTERDMVERMYLEVLYLEDPSVLPEIVEVLVRIAARWPLLFETLNTQHVLTRDRATVTAYVDKWLG